MSKNQFNLRFAIRRDDGYISSAWRLWTTKFGDVYLAGRTHGGILKYSFHKSGICRSAFTVQHGTPDKLPDRAVFKWRRESTPKKGDLEASQVASLVFPTDFLSRETKQIGKKATWISAAPNGAATFVELSYTYESEASVRGALHSKESRNLMAYTPTVVGEALLVTYYYRLWDSKDICSPTSPESIFPDLLFSENDPHNTGRPIRAVVAKPPSDGDQLLLYEFGGYKFTGP